MAALESFFTDQGFEREVGGGGALFLSRYFVGAGHVWATCLEGFGMPEPTDWHICAYGHDEDDRLFEARCDDAQPLTIEEATAQALEAALAFDPTTWPEGEVCRNGLPIADCQCC